MRISHLTYGIHIAVLVTVALAQGGPISLDHFNQKQPVYVLDEGGRILVLDQRQNEMPIRVLARVSPSYKALDILSTKLWTDRELLFITAYGLTGDDSRGRVIQFSNTGQKQCEWILPEVSVGLDVDTKNHAIYLSGAWTGSLYRLKLLQNICYGEHQLSSISQIKGAQRLGPIVVDSERQLAFVGDVLKGSVYRIDLERSIATETVRSLGQPVSFLYNDQQNELLVADAAGRRIWRINVNSFPSPTPSILSKDPQFQEPSSLTFAADHRVMVGDRLAKVIFVVDYTGRVMVRIPMP